MTESLEELLERCAQTHGHICPGQLLGIRMALLGCSLIGVEDPAGRDRKKLLVWVEVDRCMTDAIGAVTGVRLGRRSLKFVDYGKVAATFHNLAENRAVRIVARDDSRALADLRFPEIAERKERQMRAYREASDRELFKVSEVQVVLRENDLPGRPRGRVVCEGCGEGVNDGREVSGEGGRVLCRACAFGAYYRPLCDADL